MERMTFRYTCKRSTSLHVWEIFGSWVHLARIDQPRIGRPGGGRRSVYQVDRSAAAAASEAEGGEDNVETAQGGGDGE